MSWVSDLIKGRNKEVSKTKIAAWAFGLWNLVAPVTKIPVDIVNIVNTVLVTFGGLAVKDAIDKTAPPGTPAADG